MSIFNRFQTFATNGTVDAASLHNLIDATTIRQGLITSSANTTSVGTNYELLIADMTNANANPNAVTVYDLFQDALTAGTYTNANISEALSYGTATGTRLVSTNATITTGTITTGVILTLTSSTATFGTTTSTAATITSGTITNLASTTGTIATLNSTTGTIGNFSTTLTGDFTISAGTGTLGTTGVTAGTYGSASAIPFLTVDAKGRITSATSGTFSTVPADGSITPAKLSQPFTSETAVSTSGTAIDFTGIPSWVKKITVLTSGISTNGAANVVLQLGDSGGIETTGYTGALSTFGLTALQSYTSTGATGALIVAGNDASDSYRHSLTISLLDPAANLWVISGVHSRPDTVTGSLIVTKSLSATLDRIRIATANGTDAFDAGGSVNIMYEG